MAPISRYSRPSHVLLCLGTNDRGCIQSIIRGWLVDFSHRPLASDSLQIQWSGVDSTAAEITCRLTPIPYHGQSSTKSVLGSALSPILPSLYLRPSSSPLLDRFFIFLLCLISFTFPPRHLIKDRGFSYRHSLQNPPPIKPVEFQTQRRIEAYCI